MRPGMQRLAPRSMTGLESHLNLGKSVSAARGLQADYSHDHLEGRAPVALPRRCVSSRRHGYEWHFACGAVGMPSTGHPHCGMQVWRACNSAAAITVAHRVHPLAGRLLQRLLNGAWLCMPVVQICRHTRQAARQALKRSGVTASQMVAGPTTSDAPYRRALPRAHARPSYEVTKRGRTHLQCPAPPPQPVLAARCAR